MTIYDTRLSSAHGRTRPTPPRLPREYLGISSPRQKATFTTAIYCLLQCAYCTRQRVYCPRRQPHSASLHPTIRALGVAASGGTRPWHQPRPIVRTGYVRIRLRDNKDFDERTAWVRNVADHARIVPYCSLKVIYRSLPLFVAPSKLSLLSLLSVCHVSGLWPSTFRRTRIDIAPSETSPCRVATCRVQLASLSSTYRSRHAFVSVSTCVRIGLDEYSSRPRVGPRVESVGLEHARIGWV